MRIYSIFKNFPEADIFIGETLISLNKDKEYISFPLTYRGAIYFNREQSLKVEIYRNHELLENTVIVPLMEIIIKHHGKKIVQIPNEEERIVFFVTSSAVEKKRVNFKLTYHDEGDLKEKAGKKTYYYMIKRCNLNDAKTLFKSQYEIFPKKFNYIKFKNFSTNSLKLCLGDFNSEIDIFLIEANTHEEILNEKTSVNKLLKDKIIKISENSWVEIDLEIQKSHEFLDYLKQGLQLRMIMAIDFTKSNGDPNQKGTLHEYNENELNPYEKSLTVCGDIIKLYATHNTIPCFGYGAILPNRTEVSHCFPLNLDSNSNSNSAKENYEIEGMDNVLEAYNKTIRKIEFKHPTYFSPIINKVIQIAKKDLQKNEMVYNILVMLTDGKIEDRKDVVNAICEAAELPIIIIIVGVGKEHFDDMIKLERNAMFLQDSKGKQVCRDILDFIEFDKYSDDVLQLKDKIFEEVPDQICEYFTIKEINPEQFGEKYRKEIIENYDINNNKNNVSNEGNSSQKNYTLKKQSTLKAIKEEEKRSNEVSLINNNNKNLKNHRNSNLRNKGKNNVNNNKK